MPTAGSGTVEIDAPAGRDQTDPLTHMGTSATKTGRHSATPKINFLTFITKHLVVVVVVFVPYQRTIRRLRSVSL